MGNLDEVKRAILAHFQACTPKSVNMIQKLLSSQEISLAEVDDVIESLGNYQAHITCLRKFAK